MKPRLLSSFSGGKTSAFMTRWLLENKSDEYDIKVVFANTGEEDERTLKFVRDCDAVFGFGTVWVESAPIMGERKSSGHRVVEFGTAARNGEPFEAVIAKYGIPNKNFPHCTRELKLNPIKSYLASIGWETGSYSSAIGIRTDETRRVSKTAEDRNIIYPLVDMIPTDKQDVNDWFEDQVFNLELQEHEGNCRWCWKKSFAKHFRLIAENPKIYDFPRRMEATHGATGAGYTGEDRKFFRLNLSTDDLFMHAKVGSVVIPNKRQASLDLDGGCSESCELYPMEETTQ
jgi:hypothetical protein